MASICRMRTERNLTEQQGSGPIRQVPDLIPGRRAVMSLPVLTVMASPGRTVLSVEAILFIALQKGMHLLP